MSTPTNSLTTLEQIVNQLDGVTDDQAAAVRAILEAHPAPAAPVVELGPVELPAPTPADDNAAEHSDLIALVRKIPALRWRTLANRYGVDFDTVDQDLILMLIIGANELHRNGEGKGRDALERFEGMPLEELVEYVAEHNTPDEGAQKSR